MNVQIKETDAGLQIGSLPTSDKIAFFGSTPVVQPTNAAQAAVVASTDFSGGDTVDKAVVLAAVQALQTLTNRMRTDLIALGLIKGS